MSIDPWKPGRPRAILLATDLGSRCDRALDRAVLLARQWQARLVVLTVVEAAVESWPKRSADAAGRDADEARLQAAARLRRDVGDAGDGLAVELLVREGHVGTRIAEVCAETGCSLVVSGLARDEPFGRRSLGSTVEWLARNSPLPLLMVRDRARLPYRRVIVASDFSDSSRRALDTACALLPDARASLFHAFEVPFLGLMDSHRDHTEQQAHDAALAAARAFLDEAGRPGLPAAVARGEAAWCLAEHAGAQDADLVVSATHGRSALFNLVIGSVAQRILEQAPCDTLLVPEPHARATG